MTFRHARFLLVALLLALVGIAQASERTETCLFDKEQDLEGRWKLCHYSCPSGDIAVTVDDLKICPLRHTKVIK